MVSFIVLHIWSNSALSFAIIILQEASFSSCLNQYIVAAMAINPITNEPYSLGYWSSQQEKPKDQRWVEWAEKYLPDFVNGIRI